MSGPLHNRITRPLLYQSVIQRLLEIVESGEIAPGDPFPPERELVQRWMISRNVLREAFHVLNERGITTSIQGKGRFLRKLPDRAMAHPSTVMAMEKSSLSEIYEVRLVLELFGIDLAVKLAPDSEIAKLRAKFEEIKQGFLRSRARDREFELHLGYASLAGNFMLEQLVNTTIKLTSEFMSSTFVEVLRRHDVKDYVRDHGRIIGFIESRDADKAKQALTEHFNTTLAWINSYGS